LCAGLLERDHDVLGVDLVPLQEQLSSFLLRAAPDSTAEHGRGAVSR
jgi:hypothetical protein